MDRILLEDLKLECIIGILPEERLKPQPLVISLELECDLEKAGLSGDLRDTVDYFALSREIADFAKKRQAGLLEELGEELCALILKKYQADAVTLKLIKPQAVPKASGCGIEIRRMARNS